MGTTTMKIHQSTKNALDDFKSDFESYDDAINKLLLEVNKKNLVKELVEAYKSKAKEDKEIAKEWENTSPNWD